MRAETVRLREHLAQVEGDIIAVLPRAVVTENDGTVVIGAGKTVHRIRVVPMRARLRGIDVKIYGSDIDKARLRIGQGMAVQVKIAGTAVQYIGG